MTVSTLYWTNMLSWIFIVLDHRDNSPRVDSTRTHQPVFTLVP
jgi:hypothetical protein